MERITWPVAAIVVALIVAVGAVLTVRSLHPGSTVARPGSTVVRPPATRAAATVTPAPSTTPAPRHTLRPSAKAVTATTIPAPPAVDSTLLLIACDGSGSVEPSSYVLACADGNGGLSGLTWSSWTAAGATGSGQDYENNCIPNCAGGTFQYTPVTVTLSGPVNDTPAYYADMSITGQSIDIRCTANVLGGMNCS